MESDNNRLPSSKDLLRMYFDFKKDQNSLICIRNDDAFMHRSDSRSIQIIFQKRPNTSSIRHPTFVLHRSKLQSDHEIKGLNFRSGNHQGCQL